MLQNLRNEAYSNPTSVLLEGRNYHWRVVLLLKCSIVVVSLAALVLALVAALVIEQSIASALRVAVSLAPLGALFTFLVRSHSHHSRRASQQQILAAVWLMSRFDGVESITQASISLCQASTLNEPIKTDPTHFFRIALGDEKAMKHKVSET